MAGFWYSMVNAVKSATAVLVISGGLACIFFVVLFSIVKIKKFNASLAIIISTTVSCFLMVPVISAFNNLIDITVEGAVLDEGKAEIKAQRAEIERLKAENKIKALEQETLDNRIKMAKQSIEIEALNDNINLLEHAQLSIQSFEKILELALLQTTLKQTLVRKESLGTIATGWGIQADYYGDEVLVVISHDINAKFGVDLNNIKIAQIDQNTVVVSGIKSKFIGTSRNITTIPIKEIRRINYKKDVIDSIIVQNDNISKNRANNYADTYEREFQIRLSEGLELSFMDEAVVQLAQNFIKVMLAPLYKNIRFETSGRLDAVPLMEYVQKELKDTHERKNALLDVQETLNAAHRQLETETLKIEQMLTDSEE
ncbi:MAG: hypothetical protein LBQ77_07290 [Treponema sp.]|jgi:low affinity Fe/Cu permease|nr:hypothetical protein [Treponema sp.]